MKKLISFFGVIIILTGGILVSKYFLTHKIKPEKIKIEYKGPLVKCIKVKKKDYNIELTETGTVKPYRKVLIIPQVSGKIIYVSKNFFTGKIVKKDEILIKIEKIDYEVAYYNALKRLKDAELNYEITLEKARISKQELKSAKKEFKNIKPSKLKLFIPQIESALSALKLAKKNLQLAKINLKRTVIKSPYNGIVVKKQCDINEFVPAGKPIGEIFYLDKVYVYVPIPDYELPFIEFKNKNVKIILDLNGRKYNFNGILERTSKIMDFTTRTINLIITVKDPYKILKDNIRLFIGAFVKVKLNGKLFKNIAKIPSTAIHNNNQIWIYENGKLFIKKVKILKQQEDYVYVSDGIKNNEFLITTHLPYVSNGMKVRLIGRLKEK